jgi:hypothetical protein
VSRFPPQDVQEIHEELEQVLASAAFIKKPDAASMLRYLVDRALGGADDVREVEIGTVFLGRLNFDSTKDATVRKTVRDIRAALNEYHSGPTAGRIWQINLPERKYLPTLSRRKGTPPPPPPRTGRKWKKPIIIAVVVVGGALLAAASLPSLHEGHCGGDITITSPVTGTTVKTTAVIQGKKNPQHFWCWCKDYLVVEVASGPIVGARYNQGRISNSANWSLGATFGERDTEDRTEFNIFVLSTTQDLKTGVIPSSMGNPSTPISVTLKK